MSLQTWGGLAAFLLAAAMLAANWVYLTGNLNDPIGPLTYDLADLLYGPVWAASLVTVVLAARERIGNRAPRRMNLALGLALLVGAAMLAVATIRSANRHYVLMHPELHLEDTSVMVVWTTLVAGVFGAGMHLLGWAFALTGWAGLSSHRQPAILSSLYVVAGLAAMFVYLRPELEGFALLFTLVVAVWQGVVLLKARA
jgi:hypothetical protein